MYVLNKTNNIQITIIYVKIIKWVNIKKKITAPGKITLSMKALWATKTFLRETSQTPYITMISHDPR